MISKDWGISKTSFRVGRVHSAGNLAEEKSCMFNEISVVAILFLSYAEK
jgi:hypothetical protein